MSPDHLCEEGLAHQEEIEIPFNVTLFFSILLIISTGIHLNGHFYIFSQDFILDIQVMVQITTHAVLLVFSLTFQLLHQAQGNTIRLYPE